MSKEVKRLERIIKNLMKIISYMEAEIQKKEPKVKSLILSNMNNDIHSEDPTNFPVEISDAKDLVPHVLHDFS